MSRKELRAGGTGLVRLCVSCELVCVCVSPERVVVICPAATLLCEYVRIPRIPNDLPHTYSGISIPNVAPKWTYSV